MNLWVNKPLTKFRIRSEVFEHADNFYVELMLNVKYLISFSLNVQQTSPCMV